MDRFLVGKTLRLHVIRKRQLQAFGWSKYQVSKEVNVENTMDSLD